MNANEKAEFSAKLEEYKGHPLLAIYNGNGNRVVAFGKRKAEAILACLPTLKVFVEGKK